MNPVPGAVPGSPSDWVLRWSALAAPGSQVLDVACGTGRHMRCLSQLGHGVTGIDRSAEALSSAAHFGRVVQADLETQPWPLQQQGKPQPFDMLVVTNYLWRPLWPALLDSLAPGGLLIYETFALGNAQFGKPSRPDYLLRPGELLDVCRDLHIVAYENGYLAQPARLVQRIAALRPGLASPNAVWPGPVLSLE